MVDKEVNISGVEIINEALKEEKERENEQAFKIEAERAFVDQAMFSSLFSDLMQGFEAEEEALIAQKEAELR